MFKKSLFLGLTTAVAATVACLIYAKFYMGILYDFSVVFDLTKVFAYYLMFGVSAAIIQFTVHKVIGRERLAEFVLNLLITLVAIFAVLYVMKMDDPQELYDWDKYPDYEYCADFFKGFITPMIFLPALAWLTFKPLFRD